MIAVYKNLNPQSHYPVGWLSNGRYHTIVGIDGSGYSKLEEYVLNRPQEITSYSIGTYAFIHCGSSTYSFTKNSGEKSLSETFKIGTGSIYFEKNYEGLSLKNSIYVSPEDNVEIRKFSINNLSDSPQKMSLDFYSEIALSLPEAYRSHRTYQNLFIESRNDGGSIIFKRRKKYKDEKTPCMIWKIVGNENSEEINFSNDREKAFGRNNTIDTALFHKEIVNSTEYPTDHCALAQITITLDAVSERTFYLLQIADFNEERCISTASIYSSENEIEHAINKAGPAHRARYNFNLIDARHLRLLNKMIPGLLYKDVYTRSSHDAIIQNKLPISALWKFGISGERPLIIAGIYSENTLFRLEHLFKINSIINKSGLVSDFIIINHVADNYENRVREGVYKLKELYGNGNSVKIYSIRMLNEDEILLLRSVSSADFNLNIPLISQYDYMINKENKIAHNWGHTTIEESFPAFYNGLWRILKSIQKIISSIPNMENPPQCHGATF